ncbi:MAG: hypothetical protein VR72_12550 [Clostridiaceae bacterium BRH_c20a]|nr:MAG: hypothetical protein VR72_12550 [Clostridiaceae bacterium BRH_c20a]
MKVGLLGCGNIGCTIAEALINNICPGKELSAICDMKKNDKIESLLKLSNAKFVDNVEALLTMDLDVIIEAANPKVAAKYALSVIEAGTDLLLLSSGALLEPSLQKDLELASIRTKAKVIVPSGAVGGLSVIRAATLRGGLQEVTITTTKHPKSLIGAPFFSNNSIDLMNLKEKTLVFQGSASEAIKGFPQNVNIAVTVSLAGLGPEKTKIKIIADPGASLTRHELQVKGDFGTMKLELENKVSPDNPRSSYLASLSAISALKDFDNHILIGF